MFGNQKIINIILSEDPNNPIQKVGDNDIKRIVEVLFDEQWKELGRQYQFCEEDKITVPNFGSFTVRNSQLRKYIWDSVRYLRKLRKRIERLSKQKDFNPEQSMTVLIERDLVLKLRAAWKQLDKLRYNWRDRAEQWEIKKSIKAQKSNKIDI